MTTPSPFEIGRSIGQNVGSGFQQARDTSALEQILSEAVASNDPAVLNSAIGQILSRVSPERQGQALNLLQNQVKNISDRRKSGKQEANQLFKEIRDRANQDIKILKSKFSSNELNFNKEKQKEFRKGVEEIERNRDELLNQTAQKFGILDFQPQTPSPSQQRTRVLTEEDRKRISKEAGGDPEKAVQIALEQGFDV